MKLRILSILSITLIALSSCSSGSSSDNYAGYDSDVPSYVQEQRQPTEAELKAELKSKECSSAEEYLDGTMSCKPIYKNALSLKVKGLKITCNIVNNATLARYKDIICRISLKSKTGSTIKNEDITIYDYIDARGSYAYKGEIEISNQQYKDLSDWSWKIINAQCAN